MKKKLLVTMLTLAMAGSLMACGSKAVSYTHLDVYKRQAMCWSAIWD